MNRMARLDPKKIATSGFVLVLFVLYSFSARHNDAPTPVVQNKNSGSSSVAPVASPKSRAGYRDGEYVGSVADAFYGDIQVKATVSGGKITGVDFLKYPNDRPESVSINTQAMPYLKQEAIQAQNAHVDSVSGATDTSRAFVESITAALNKAM